MGWAVGYDNKWKRDIGYGVPCICEHPDCNKEIDRGLGYVCGGEPYGGEDGCGLFFCGKHLLLGHEEKTSQLCERCFHDKEPYEPKQDIKEWFDWKITDASWAFWLEENFNDIYTGV